jgi:hypothetical protein
MPEPSPFESDLRCATGATTINQNLQTQLLELLDEIERLNVMSEDHTVPADQGIADITTQMRPLINRILH